MTNYVFPSNSVLTQIAQSLLPQVTLNDPIFDHFPVTTQDTDQVMWEQFDRFNGLATARGLGGQPAKVQPVGLSRYQMQPGYYGEFMVIDEKDLTRLRQPGSYNAPLDLSPLVAQKQAQLMTRQTNQMRRILWTLVSTGSITAVDGAGITQYAESYTFQALAGSAWSTPASGTPLADFRAAQLKHRGYSVRFNRRAKAYMNKITFNYISANTNAADIYGKRTAGLATPLGLDEVNTVLLGEDLPQIEINDDGYLDSSNSFQPFIADKKIVIIGEREDLAPLGNYVMTRNASNDGFAPGQYSYVIDSAQYGKRTPREFEVHLGHNGGCAVEYPSAVIILTVS